MDFFVIFLRQRKGNTKKVPKPNANNKTPKDFDNPNQAAKLAPNFISPPPNPFGISWAVPYKTNPITKTPFTMSKIFADESKPSLEKSKPVKAKKFVKV